MTCNFVAMKTKKTISKKKFDFTAHEIALIKHIFNQKSNIEMATLFKKSMRTIEGHRQIVYKKAGVTNSVGLVLFALRQRICVLK